MMSFKRLGLVTGTLLLALSLAMSAQAKTFKLTGGGGQGHIGNGLMLPIQPAAVTTVTTGNTFPPLLVPAIVGKIIEGTIVKPQLHEHGGTKVGYQRQMTVPKAALHKLASTNTVGVKFSNALVYAVGTNLDYVWPQDDSVFGTAAQLAAAGAPPLGTASVSNFGGSVKYSNALGQRFGGAAFFKLSPGSGGGHLLNGTTGPDVAVTVYLKIGTATPSTCGGGCTVGVIGAVPNAARFGPGGTTVNVVTTPGVPLTAANVAVAAMGTSPSGTILGTPFFVAHTPAVPTNKATSQPAPWTTGQVVISMPAVNEKFTLSGKDSRTIFGAGTIQLVSGAVSKRNASGNNANRGWVELQLEAVHRSPALSPIAQAALAGLVLLAGGYIARRQFATQQISA